MENPNDTEVCDMQRFGSMLAVLTAAAAAAGAGGSDPAVGSAVEEGPHRPVSVVSISVQPWQKVSIYIYLFCVSLKQSKQQSRVLCSAATPKSEGPRLI